MTIGWATRTFGVFGSGVVHLAIAGWAVLAVYGGYQIICVWPPRPTMSVFDVSQPASQFYLAPLPDRDADAIRLGAVDCAGRATARPLVLLGRAPFTQSRPTPRTPRLCIRVAPTGQVTSARVLRSSGDPIVDGETERQALALRFEPARDGQPAAAVTGTLEIAGGQLPPISDVPEPVVAIAPL